MIYVIIRGLRSCSDDDELKGYFTSKQDAEAYCEKMQALEKQSSRYWMVEELDKL